MKQHEIEEAKRDLARMLAARRIRVAGDEPPADKKKPVPAKPKKKIHPRTARHKEEVRAHKEEMQKRRVEREASAKLVRDAVAHFRAERKATKPDRDRESERRRYLAQKAAWLQSPEYHRELAAWEAGTGPKPRTSPYRAPYTQKELVRRRERERRTKKLERAAFKLTPEYALKQAAKAEKKRQSKARSVEAHRQRSKKRNSEIYRLAKLQLGRDRFDKKTKAWIMLPGHEDKKQ